MRFSGDVSCGVIDLRRNSAPGWHEFLRELCRAVQSLSVEPAAVEQSVHSAAADSAASLDLVEISKALRGDDQAYARLVRRYQPLVTSQVWRASRRRDDCEELVQEVFVEAYLSLGKFRAKSPFLHWLRKITTRVCYRYWKRQARLRRHTPLSDAQWRQIASDGSAAINADRAADLVHDLLAKLSARNRLVMTLLFLEDCSVGEAAELTGWSRTMVKVQCYRARQKLKALLNEVSQ